MEFKGTPGPWRVVKDEEYPTLHQIWSDDESKCLLGTYIARTAYAIKSKENAQLISKAPEMLELLKKSASIIRRLKWSMMSHPDHVEGSEFDDYTSLAQQMEEEVEKLLAEATTLNQPG